MKANSWIVTRKSDGEVILETFSAELAQAINREKYLVQDAFTYLVELNKKLRP